MFSEVHLDCIQCLGYYFLRNKYPTILYFPYVAQGEEDPWRIQVEAQEAYVCKQILGLCHSSPQLECQVKVEHKKTKSCRRKKFPRE